MSEIFAPATPSGYPQHAAAADCPACASRQITHFCTVENVPANSCILMKTEEEARNYPTGTIDLGFCGECGFIFNTTFEEAKAKYSDRYEETQGFSGVFNAFHKALAERIIAKYDLHGKKIVEIGCGKGEFLVLLAQLGGNQGIGIDPGVHLDRLPAEVLKRLTFIQDFYSEDHITDDVDFVVCKMTLEHIPAAFDFIAKVHGGVENRANATVFFQVPDAHRILQDCAFEDIYYEHCSYYSLGSLARLFRRAGFSILDASSEYDGQYLTLEARSVANASTLPIPGEADLYELNGLVDNFPERWSRRMDEWSETLSAFRRQGKTIALWGSGSKAVSFITTLNVADQIAFVTDVNPYRHGHFLPKSAHPIVSPKTLAEARPDVVIAMNRIYRGEIAAELQSLGVQCELLAL